MSRTKKNTPGGNKKKPKQKKEKTEKKEVVKTKAVVNVDEKLAESEDKSTKSVAVVEKKVEEEVKEVKEVGKKVPHPATLSPYRLDEAQALKATIALLKHISTAPADENSKPNLLEDPENPAESAVALWLQLNTKKYITDTKKLKPLRIPIPHALRDPTTTTVCLIVKDPQRHFKDLVASAGLSSVVTRVIGVGKLRKKYKAFENRRQLLDSHDVFLADDRIITMLPAALGKPFYRQTAKIPLPLPLAAGNGSPSYLKNQVEKALKSTYAHLSPAATTSIRVALSSMTPKQMVENIVRVVEDLTSKKVPGGWKNVKSLHIKYPSSASLPIYMAADIYGEEDVLTPEEQQERALALANKVADRKEKKEKKNAKRKSLSEMKPVEDEKEAETPKKKKVKVVSEEKE